MLLRSLVDPLTLAEPVPISSLVPRQANSLGSFPPASNAFDQFSVAFAESDHFPSAELGLWRSLAIAYLHLRPSSSVYRAEAVAVKEETTRSKIKGNF